MTPRVELEWGVSGGRYLARSADAVVVVDVLSFCTSVVIACQRGVRVWPHPGGPQAEALADCVDAVLARPRSHGGGPTLSPASLLQVAPGSRLVLPSPNGSAVAHALSGAPAQVVAGCLRNAAAVARRVAGFRRVALVPAGERWSDSSIRFAYEDLVGAGAIVVRLRSLVPDIASSPEADAAALAFEHCRPLADTTSGKELTIRGFGADVRLAGEVDASDVVPVLNNGCFEA